MFGMGWQEILLVLVIAVLVIGPDQLPQVARTIGKMIAQFRRVTNDLRDSMNREFKDNEDFRDFREFQQSIDSEVRSIGHVAQSYVDKEVAKEEAELTKLEEEIRGNGSLGDPPGEPQSDWTLGGDAPADETAQPAPPSEDTAADAAASPPAEQTAEHPAAESEAAPPPSPHKETA